MPTQPVSFKRHRFQPDVIRLAIWLYFHDIAVNKKIVPLPAADNLTWDEFSRVNGLYLRMGAFPGNRSAAEYAFAEIV